MGHSNSLLDIRIFTGAGGGGAAPQGSGFIVHPTIGIGKQLNKQFFIMTELGYMHFINGDISSISLGVSINMNMWRLRHQKGVSNDT